MKREIKIQAYLPAINLMLHHVVVYAEGMIGFHETLFDNQLEEGYELDCDGLYLWDDEGNQVKIIDFYSDDEWIFIEHDGDFHLRQYTGLKDEGREMYEDDLFELLLTGINTHTELALYQIKWSTKSAGFGFFRITKESEQPKWIGMNDNQILDKVLIGNIHENPELLKPQS